MKGIVIRQVFQIPRFIKKNLIVILKRFLKLQLFKKSKQIFFKIYIFYSSKIYELRE